MAFTVRLRDGRRLRFEVTAASKGECRRRGKRKAEEVLATDDSDWQLSQPLADYVDKVARPAIEKANLGDLTRERYESSIRFLLGDCRNCKRQGKKHVHGFRQHTIGSGTTARAIEQTFTEIAKTHGLSTAKSCRTVWNKYIAKHLVLDGLMRSNPVVGQRLTDLTGVEKPPRSRGGRALTRAEYDKALEWLLAADPSDWLVSHKKHGWIWEPEVQIATHQTAIDFTLLQMTTGLRQSEARLADWTLAGKNASGMMSISVPEHVAKGGIPRVVLVLDNQVSERLDVRRKAQRGEGAIVGAPMDTMKVWNRMRCGEVTKKLYLRMAEELGIDLFKDQRSHVWRTTLRSFYVGLVPEAVLNSQFGHSTEIANLYYTDSSDLSLLADASGQGRFA